MALTATGLSDAIKAKLDATAGPVSAETGESGDTWRKQFADDIAAAIIEYMTANTVVSVTNSCPAGAGTGTGTIS